MEKGVDMFMGGERVLLVTLGEVTFKLPFYFLFNFLNYFIY